MVNSKVKGRSFEQRIATIVRTKWPNAIVRRSQQAHMAYEPDVVIEGEAPIMARRLWLECHDSRAPNPLTKLEQAIRDVEHKPMSIPTAVCHRLGARTITATLRLSDLITIMHASWTYDVGPSPVTLAFDDLLTLCGDHAP